MNIKIIFITLLFFTIATHGMNIPSKKASPKETYFDSFMRSITNSWSSSLSISPIEQYSDFPEDSATDMSGSLAFPDQTTPQNPPIPSETIMQNDNQTKEEITQQKKKHYCWLCCCCICHNKQKSGYQEIK